MFRKIIVGGLVMVVLVVAMTEQAEARRRGRLFGHRRTSDCCHAETRQVKDAPAVATESPAVATEHPPTATQEKEGPRAEINWVCTATVRCVPPSGGTPTSFTCQANGDSEVQARRRLCETAARHCSLGFVLLNVRCREDSVVTPGCSLTGGADIPNGWRFYARSYTYSPTEPGLTPPHFSVGFAATESAAQTMGIASAIRVHTGASVTYPNPMTTPPDTWAKAP